MNIMPSSSMQQGFLAKILVEKGYFPLPCEGKTPIGNWRGRTDPFEIGFEGRNIGLRCGDGGLLGIDIDIDDPGVAEAVAAGCWSLMGALVRVGRPMRRMLVCRTAAPTKSRDLTYLKDGVKEKIQLIGEGRQFIAHGVHPDTGRAYSWDGPSCFDVALADLPLVDVGAVEAEMDAAMARLGRSRQATAERTGAVFELPDDLTAAEKEALARWGAAEVAKVVEEVTGAPAGTGRGSTAHELGLRIGPLVLAGLLDRGTIEDRLWWATLDDNAAHHSFFRGVGMSEGEAVSAKLSTIRKPAAVVSAIAAAPGFDDPPPRQGKLLDALRDRAARLASRRSSKQTVKDRAEFARLCAALEKDGRLTEMLSFELGSIAKAYKGSDQAFPRNPMLATPAAVTLAKSLVETEENGGCLITALGLSEAVVRAPPTYELGLPDIEGGVHPANDDTFEVISSRLTGVNRNGSIYYVHRTLDGVDQRIAPEALPRLFPNVFVGDAEGNRTLAVTWWMQHPRFKNKNAVFVVEGRVEDDEYNFWRGFGVDRRPGWQKLRHFGRHLFHVICSGDRIKFRYLVRWLAWAVQNPGDNPETVVVLKSASEGTGKSTVSVAMKKLLGQHGVIVDKPEQLLGKHNEHLEFAAFVGIEEALFAGDPRQSSALRSQITSNTLMTEPKFMRAYETPNIMHAILTTNHDWAIHAGQDARRWFVCEVADEKERTLREGYFREIYGDLESGGYEQLLNFLLGLNLKKIDWHPRQLVRTRELRDQQMLSADSVTQWLRGCMEDDGIEHESDSGTISRLNLGREWQTTTLYKAFCHNIRLSTGHRNGVSRDAFSKRLMAILGAKNFKRNVAEDGTERRSRGYLVPTAWELEGILEKLLCGKRR